MKAGEEMFADDFLFNGQKASDYGMMIASDSGGEAVVSGGEVEITSVRPPDKDIFDFYTGRFESPIQFTFSILKFSCDNPDDVYLTQEEESRIAKWLIGQSKTKGYGWLQFDQDGYRDVCYKVAFTSMQPIQVIGRTVGFELTAVSNCGYGFSNEMNVIFQLDSSHPKELHVHSDINTYIYPHVTFTNLPVLTNVKFHSNTEGVDINRTEFNTTAIQGTPVVMDCENDIIDGIQTPNDFNWYFPRIADGLNTFTTDNTTPFTVELKYREPRRILI